MSRKMFFTTAFMLVLLGTLYLLYQVLSPFISALLWAGILAVVFYPAYKQLLGAFKGKNESLAALLMCLGLTCLVLLPATLILVMLVREMLDGAQHLVEGFKQLSLRKEQFLQNPWVATIQGLISQYVDLDSFDPEATLMANVNKISSWLVAKSSLFLKTFSNFLIMLVLTGLIMFFFFRDGKLFVQYVKDLIPISARDKRHIVSRLKETIHAAIFGTVLTASVQGFLGGVVFAALGIHAPILWGVLMAFMALIPLAGTSLVWGPAAIYLYFTGHGIQALILVALGIGVIGTVDNFLRPFFISKVSSAGNRLNTLVLFLSILGGIKAFGFLGIVLGPLLIVFTILLLELGKVSLGLIPTEENPGAPPLSPGNPDAPLGDADAPATVA